MRNKKKKPMTLLEIMIVIFIIGIIGSVIGFNMKGSLEKGKVFKTKEGIKKLYDIFSYELAQGESLENIIDNSREIVSRSGLAKNSKDLLKDGWNQEYILSQDQETSDIRIYSPNYQAYCEKKNIDPDYPW